MFVESNVFFFSPRFLFALPNLSCSSFNLKGHLNQHRQKTEKIHFNSKHFSDPKREKKIKWDLLLSSIERWNRWERLPASRGRCCKVFRGPGLPDGIFSHQKSQFGSILEGVAKEDVCLFWSILRPIGIFCGPLEYFMIILVYFPLLVCCTDKNLATPEHKS
jgi:hypothetical protein